MHENEGKDGTGPVCVIQFDGGSLYIDIYICMLGSRLTRITKYRSRLYPTWMLMTVLCKDRISIP